jgi:predicted ATPase/signal transduction histidine kinase/tRNA A-37 threonylcarbamoyl transferase component Bud32
MTVALPGYEIGQTIYIGPKTLVYRGLRQFDNQPVVIKFLRNEYPNFSELLEFRNQYTIAKNLNIPGIIRPHSLEPYGNSYALVMADFGGISLREYSQIHSLEVAEVLTIAIKMTEILHQLHACRVIHKDIKPANILINPETKQVKLIDFCIASLLPRETQEILNPNVLEGTLAYISPEQTGRMNRSIDYRSDFYSLGVTFYELLTGKLPFVSDDPMQLVHCHLAKQPDAIHTIKADIPIILSQIVGKLMAKNAENRYQTALGVKHDLEICLVQLKKTGKIDDFELGKRDLTDRFIIPEKLYGRETEVETLLQAFERVAKGPQPGQAQGDSPYSKGGLGGGEMMLVAGFSGIGKTAIVNEVHKPIVRQRGYFIKGKFDQFNRNIPLSAFVQAFRDLMGQLLSESDAQMQIWKTKILEAVGENGQVLIEVIPELRNIIGTQPAAQELSGSAAENRFNRVMQKFVQIFTSVEHPLVIFLDDLQWADSASLKLLQLLMQDTGYLLVLGAYRDREVSPAHPFILTVDELVKTGITVNTITLQPLSLADLNLLVADTLNCDAQLAQPLTELVHQKTKGNPFFATQFLKALHDDKLISFDPPVSPTPLSSPLSKGGQRAGLFHSHENLDFVGVVDGACLPPLPTIECAFGTRRAGTGAPPLQENETALGQRGVQGGWQCDLARVKASATTDDVVEFMALQLQKLPAETQHSLKLAACIGAQFDLNTLAIVSQSSEIEAASTLWPALQQGLIIPNTEIYKFFMPSDSASVSDTAANPIYRFLHDRVQQAAYSLIPDDQKQATHYQIGQLLLQIISPEAREKRIFELVNQLNYGTDLITQPSQRDELVKLNLIAGSKARGATAYQAAREYVTVGLLMLGETAWETQYQMTLSYHELAAEVAWLCGDFERMEQWIEAVLQTAKTPLEEVKVYQIKIDALTGQNNFLEAIAIGKIVLNRLGVDLPDSPTPNDAQQAMQEIVAALGTRPVEELFHLPKMVDAQQMAIVKIAGTLIAPCYGAHSPYLFLITALPVQRSIQFGNSPNSAFGYAVYGVLLSMLFRNIGLAEQFGRLAHRLIRESDTKSYRTAVLCAIGILRHRICHVRETLPLFQEGYQVGVETGTLDYAGQNVSMFVWYTFWSGHNLMELAPQFEAYQQELLSFNQIAQSDYCLMCSESVLMLLDRPEYRAIADRQEELVAQKLANNDLLWVFKLNLQRFTVNFLIGNILQAEQQAAQARCYLKVGAGNLGEIIFYFYDSLTALATVAVDRTSLEAQQQRVENNQIQLEFFASHAPMNYLHKWQLVEAEKCRVSGNNYEAVDWYDRAISGAQENQYLQEEALANELAAKFYLDWGKEKFAACYMQEAYYCYAKWGAKAKTDALETRYPQLLQPILQQANQPLSVLETLTTTAPSTHSSDSIARKSIANNSLNHTLDFAALLKVSQTLSSTIELDELVQTLTQAMLKNSGASKCALMLCQEGEWQVRAIANLEQTTLQAVPLENNVNLPLKLIQYVKNALTSIAIDDLDTDLPVIGNYLSQHQPKSVLCLPILNQGNLVAILYLENQTTSGVFTGDRILILNFLCTQAAISLENARLYQNLQQSENNEREKAEQLAQTLELLQIENSKLAFRSDVDAAFTRDESLSTMLQSCTEKIVQHLNVAFARIWTLNQDENVLELQASAGQYTHLDGSHSRIPVGKFKIGLIAQERRPHLTNDVLNDARVSNKAWAKQQGMTAFAGYPLIVADRLVGVVGMFARQSLTDEILQMLMLVADEIASGIRRKQVEQALQQSEIQIRQKAQQLENALQQLEQSQVQLVQSEKMSALGNLVAGVAHEINNPIGCIVGNVGAAQDYINDLLGVIDLYGEKFPQPGADIEDELEAIDLEYVREDLPKLIKAMKDGGDRITSISNSLRTFSRADSDTKQKFNLHDGIDSTVLILRHRLKANDNRPAIQVITEYGKIPEVSCFPGQLNQVFMNILANAIDVLDESNVGRSFAQIKDNPNRIIIQTSVIERQVKITIADNGMGMSESVKQKIFDHLFTTKRVGKGTGLGLAIARQIIVEKHGGAIEVNSTLGRGTEFAIELPIA